jgi:phosphoribosylformylglycinamidine cyclo-ligase
MGVGMVAVICAEDADRALAMLTARHVPAWVLGEVARGKDIAPDTADAVILSGDHPRF